MHHIALDICICANEEEYSLKEKGILNKIQTSHFGILMFGLYYFTLWLDLSTINHNFPKVVLLIKLLRYICYLYFIFIIFNRIIKLDISEYMNKIKLFNLKQWVLFVLALFAVISIVINFVLTKNKTMIFLLLALCYAACFDFDTIIDSVTNMQFIVMVLFITLCSFGIMFDYVNLRTDGTVRHSLGFGYPTYLAQLVLFYILHASYRRDFKVDFKEIGISQLLVLFVYFVTNSRTEFLVSELIVLCLILNRFGIANKIGMIINVIKRLFASLFILYPIGSFVIVNTFGYVFNYVNVNNLLFKVFSKLNSVLSNRLYQTFYNFKRSGYSLFGSNIDLVGYSLDNANEYSIVRSNFIDNEYMRILFENGWILFISFFIILAVVIWYLYKNKKDGLLFIAFITTTFSLLNPRITSITFSIFCFVIIPVLHDLLFNKESGGHLDE